jgi:hypothetical protein
MYKKPRIPAGTGGFARLVYSDKSEIVNSVLFLVSLKIAERQKQ